VHLNSSSCSTISCLCRRQSWAHKTFFYVCNAPTTWKDFRNCIFEMLKKCCFRASCLHVYCCNFSQQFITSSPLSFKERLFCNSYHHICNHNFFRSLHLFREMLLRNCIFAFRNQSWKCGRKKLRNCNWGSYLQNRT
jgi:hypothetical protein